MLKRYRYSIAFVCCILIIIVSGCSLSPPGAPIWSINVSIPFQNRTYKLAEMVADSAKLAEKGYGLVYASDGELLAFVYRDTLERQDLDSELNYEESDTGSYLNEIGTIEIDSPDPDSSVTTTSQLFTQLSLPYTGPLDSIRFANINDTMEFDKFIWVQLSDAWMQVSVRNEMPVPIEQLRLEYFNLTNSTYIGEFNFRSPIESGEIVTDSLLINNRLLRSKIVVRISGSIASQTQNVTIRGSEQLKTALSFSNIESDSANAEIHSHSFNTEDSLEFEDENRLTRGIVKEGHAIILMSNSASLRSINRTVFTNILDVDGQPLVYEAILEPGSPTNPWVLEDSVDLASRIITMDIDNQQIFLTNSTVTEDSRTTLFNGSAFQTVSRYNGVDCQYWTGELIYEQVTGIINSVEVDIPEKTSHLNLPEGLDNIEFIGDTLFLEIFNGIGLPVKLEAVLKGINAEDSRTSFLHVNSDLVGGLNLLAIPDGDSLLTIGPEQITLSGQARIGTDYFPELADSVVTLVDTAGFQGTMELRSDMRLILGQTQFRSDLQLISEQLDYPIQSAVINLQIANAIPSAGKIIITAGSDTTNMTTLVSVDLVPPIIENFRVVEPVLDTISVVLGQPEFDIIMQPNVYTRQIIRLRGLTETQVWLYGEDSLSVNADAEIEYLIDPTNGNGSQQ
ncbi:hypothetical protein ACFLQV_02340 [Calditrichota bacterium]